MSTDKDNHKSDEMKVDEKGDAKQDIKKVETNDIEKEVKDEGGNKSSDESEPEPEKAKKETPKKSVVKVKETKKEEKSEEEDEDENENDDEKEDDDDEEEDGKNDKKADKDVPLLDQPLQVSGARERKKVERFTVDKSEIKETSAVEIPEGKGVSLGNIGIIENNISRHKSDDLKKFHQVLFGRQGKATLIKKNIRKFNGFDFDKESDQYEKKKASLAKLDQRYLKEIASILDLTKGGTREELSIRLLDFLMEPKGAGADTPVVASKGGLTKGGRPRRSAAAKANNKGYSESDDDGDRAPRSRRAKGKRPNLKDESSSEDEKVKNDNDDEEGNDEKGSDEDALPEDETPSSDESDDPKSKKKRAPPPKAAPKKSKKKSTPAKKEKPAPKKRKPDSDEEDEEESSEDDQPLVKKAKAPPTDDEIKTYVKEILEGANLEEITMKTVCKQVYSHYPEFDLAHKKDFIKTTVKSLIST